MVILEWNSLSILEVLLYLHANRNYNLCIWMDYDGIVAQFDVYLLEAKLVYLDDEYATGAVKSTYTLDTEYAIPRMK